LTIWWLLVVAVVLVMALAVVVVPVVIALPQAHLAATHQPKHNWRCFFQRTTR
jgi:hypothetical protein